MAMILCKIRKRSRTSLYTTFLFLLTIYRYDFEFEDDGEEDNADVDIENKYYNAKQMKVANPEDAIDEFLGVPALEKEKSEWGFKGLKQAIKLEFKLGRYEKVYY
jgi:COP9 signalosome complex subunit 2